MPANALEMKIIAGSESRTVKFVPKRLVVAGWTGRDNEALQAHIDELGKLGVPAPTRTPTYMNLSAALLTTDDLIDIVGPESSGEVECVLFKYDTRLYVGVGSDHTDRAMEVHGIPASKQMCAKPVAPLIWRYEEVADHLDRLILRSWMTVNGVRRVYQEGALGDNRNIMDILQGIPADDGLELDGCCLFCGTFEAKGGIAYGERFEFEIEDPLLDRRINHSYRLRILPQYL
jgi:hypothetical protein